LAKSLSGLEVERMARRAGWHVTAVLACAAAAAALTSLVLGPAHLSIGQVLTALAGGGDEITRVIVWELRLPRMLLALMIGATLGMAGAALQGYARNPLASPEILGIPNFAALGAVLVIYIGASGTVSLAVPLAAIAMAFASALLLMALAGRAADMLTLVLAGLALSTLAGALTSLALSLASNPFAVTEIAFWLLGSLSSRSYEHVLLAAPFMVASWVIFLMMRRSLLALTLDEDSAQSLGADLPALRFWIALAVAMGVGAAVAVAGAIGFVGLIVPHLVRPFAGYDPARIVVPSALAGAALLTGADCLTQLIPATAEIKLGVLTSLIGAPFFLLLVARARRGRPAFL
jgi:iron complex transport system permease protein